MLFFTENTSRLRHSGVVWAIYCNVRVRPIPENTAQTLLRFERLFLKCGESPANAPVRDETNENAESCSGDAAECGPKNLSCASGFPHRSRQGLNWIWLGYKQSLVSHSWHRLWHFGWYFWNCFALQFALQVLSEFMMMSPLKGVKNILWDAGDSGKWFTVYAMCVNDVRMPLRKQICCEKVLDLIQSQLV